MTQNTSYVYKNDVSCPLERLRQSSHCDNYEDSFALEEACHSGRCVPKQDRNSPECKPCATACGLRQ